MSGPEERDIRDAARALERYGIIHEKKDQQTYRMVKRHSAELRKRFGDALGYRLVIEPSFVRVLKPPLSDTSPARQITSNKTPASARIHQYLCLVCSALLAPGTPDQVLISTLITQVRADAASADIVISDTFAERRDLVAAVNILLGWGAVEETDGSVAGWAADQQTEALITVDKAVISSLIANRSGVDAREDRPVRNITQRLVEDPVLDVASLTEEEQRVWVKDRITIERHLESLFGLRLEVRREGAIAWDEDEGATDERFPGAGAYRHLSLLFLSEVTAGGRPENGGELTVSTSEASGIVLRLLAENRKRFRNDLNPDQPGAVETGLAAVIDTLSKVGLLKEADGMIALHPASARYAVELTRQQAPEPAPSAAHQHIALFDDYDESHR